MLEEFCYTLSGRCRVMRAGERFHAERCVAPDCWAAISNSAGKLERALRAAELADPHCIRSSAA